VLRAQVGELFYITHVANVAGIVDKGILSHNSAARLAPTRVDLDTVQEIRARIPIGARMLHDHANLYVCGRNAMMYYVVHQNPIDSICLLRVAPEVLDLPDVVIADGNAARRGETRFDDVRTGLAALDFERVHAHSWIHEGDPVATYEHKRVKQAEVLVPDRIDPTLVIGAYAPTPGAEAAVLAGAPRLPVIVTRYTFFDGHGWQ
jgi:hypothetical protein